MCEKHNEEKKPNTRGHLVCSSCNLTRSEHKELWNRDITVDHIDGKGYNSEIKNNVLENLQTLCLPCHGRKDRLMVIARQDNE